MIVGPGSPAAPETPDGADVPLCGVGEPWGDTNEPECPDPWSARRGAAVRLKRVTAAALTPSSRAVTRPASPAPVSSRGERVCIPDDETTNLTAAC